MSRITATTRRATITLRDRKVYVADRADLEGHRLTFTGRLRTRTLHGDLYGPTAEHTFTLGQVRSIDWHKGER